VTFTNITINVTSQRNILLYLEGTSITINISPRKDEGYYLFCKSGRDPLWSQGWQPPENKGPKSISSCAQYVICTVKVDGKMSKYAGLAQDNGFGSVHFHSLQWLGKGISTLYTCHKECIK
jgi:hypothetical protein